MIGDGQMTAFALGYPIAKEPDSIKVAAAVQTMGPKGVDTVKQVYWAKSDPIINFATPPGNGVAIEVKYYGEYDILVMREDAAAIAARQAIEGGTGITEAMDDEPSLASKDAALAAALAKLDKYGIIGELFSCETFTYGLEPAQLVTIDYPEYGLNNAELLIESVEISEYAPDTPLFTIKAILGPEQGDWSKLFGRLARMKDEVLDRLNVGKDQVLIIVSNHAGEVEVSEAVTETVYACEVCDVTTICGPGIIVC